MVTLPTRTATGSPPVPLTDEQKYLFDTRGWLLFPGVLAPDEIEAMRAFSYRLHDDPATVPLDQRSPVAGPLQPLIDHPVLVGFMNAFVAHGPLATEQGYGFRLEGTFLTIRRNGHDNYRPHGGSGLFNPHGNSHHYFCQPGVVNSALTRAVWELNPVRKGDGGTVFLTGSHKAAFPPPRSVIEDRHSPLWDDYECPAGSLLVFTEAICHSGARWINPDTDRVAVFHCYNTVGAKWHRWEPAPEVVAVMPPLRRSLFRGVYCESNAVLPDAG
jgi:hypothetical protein